MKYRVLIFSNTNVRGIMEVAWVQSGTPDSHDDTQEVMNVQIDLNGTSCTELTIPFLASSGALPLTGTSSQVNGYLQFRLISNLLGYASLRVTVLSTGGDDLLFGVPASFVQQTPGGALSTIQNFELQMLGAANCVEKELTFPINKDGFDVTDYCFGEEIKSVRPLCQKFCQVAETSASVPGTSFTTVVIPKWLGPPNVGQQIGEWVTTSGTSVFTGYFTPFTYFGYYSSMYVGLAGSVRVKVIPTGSIGVSYSIFGSGEQGAQSAIFGKATPNGTNADVNIHKLAGYCAPGSFVEVTLPYYYIQRWWPRGFNVIVPGGATPTSLTYPCVCMTLTGSPCSVLYASGPDFSFVRFRRTPVITYF